MPLQLEQDLLKLFLWIGQQMLMITILLAIAQAKPLIS